MQTNSKTNTLVKLGMLAALGVVLMLILRFPLIPTAPYLIYDAGDVAALVAGFVFGPLYGLCVVVVTSIIQAVTVDVLGGWIGMVAHICASGIFVLVSGFLYKKFHTLAGAAIALITGGIFMTIVMILLNIYVFLPLFNIPSSAVPETITVAIIPFNLLKALFNSILTFVVYKAASGFLTKESFNFKNRNKK